MTDSVESVLQKSREEFEKWSLSVGAKPDDPMADFCWQIWQASHSALEPILAEHGSYFALEDRCLIAEAKVSGLSARAEAAEQALREARQLIKDYEEVNEDKKRLVRELDVAMNGKEGAAQQASLCDLIGPAEDMRAENEKLRDLITELLPFIERRRVNINPCPLKECGHESCGLVRKVQALSPSPTPVQDTNTQSLCRAKPSPDSATPRQYTNREGDRCSQACGEDRHGECTETYETCNCTCRVGHNTPHRYSNIRAAATTGKGEQG